MKDHVSNSVFSAYFLFFSFHSLIDRVSYGLAGTGTTRTLENSDGGSEVVDPSGGTESSSDDSGRGDEIVGESVVEVALDWEAISRIFNVAEPGLMMT